MTHLTSTHTEVAKDIYTTMAEMIASVLVRKVPAFAFNSDLQRIFEPHFHIPYKPENFAVPDSAEAREKYGNILKNVTADHVDTLITGIANVLRQLMDKNGHPFGKEVLYLWPFLKNPQPNNTEEKKAFNCALQRFAENCGATWEDVSATSINFSLRIAPHGRLLVTYRFRESQRDRKDSLKEILDGMNLENTYVGCAGDQDKIYPYCDPDDLDKKAQFSHLAQPRLKGPYELVLCTKAALPGRSFLSNWIDNFDGVKAYLEYLQSLESAQSAEECAKHEDIIARMEHLKSRLETLLTSYGLAIPSVEDDDDHALSGQVLLLPRTEGEEAKEVTILRTREEIDEFNARYAVSYIADLVDLVICGGGYICQSSDNDNINSLPWSLRGGYWETKFINLANMTVGDLTVNRDVTAHLAKIAGSTGIADFEPGDVVLRFHELTKDDRFFPVPRGQAAQFLDLPEEEIETQTPEPGREPSGRA